jgi:hypothetical protein
LVSKSSPAGIGGAASIRVVSSSNGCGGTAGASVREQSAPTKRMAKLREKAGLRPQHRSQAGVRKSIVPLRFAPP